MDLSPFMGTRKLTRCVTVNSTGEERERFIEVENFKLWEFLVTNKHGLEVRSEQPCVWVSAGDFSKNAEVHYHSGEVEPVNRLVISMFDEGVGYTTIIERFTHRSDSFKQLNIINGHIEVEHDEDTSVESAVIPGYVVTRQRMWNRPRLVTPAG